MDERDATRAGESDGSRPTTGTGDPAPVVVVDNWYFDPAGEGADNAGDGLDADADDLLDQHGDSVPPSGDRSLYADTTPLGDRFDFDTVSPKVSTRALTSARTHSENIRAVDVRQDQDGIAIAQTDEGASPSWSRGDGASEGAATVSLTAIPTDTLFGDQWHLLNTGQYGGQAGVDINVTGVWDDYTGAGIRVGVVDDGIQYTHHDLDDNYNPSGQYDYGGNDADPIATVSDPHGTAVAGLIVGENNGSGSVGVAFDASATAFRIFGGVVTEAEFADVYNRHAAELDISNNSWGYNGYFYDNLDGVLFDDAGTAIENAAANGRDGLGTVMLWAAGNSRQSGQDVNYHGFENARETIAVAAIDNTGEISYYSTPGAAILVGSPSSGGTFDIVTADLLGDDGYSSGDFTYWFGGTSAATPIAAGVVALMLEANGALGYRDVQEILAYSARQVDASDPSWTYNGAANWNGGGLHTSHDFGFGLIDAHAAVRLAETWTDQSTAANEVSVSASSVPFQAIADNTTVSDQVFIGSGVDIEHVEVDINIAHTWIGDLTVTLIAPDGTRSVLVNRPGVSDSSIYGTNQDNIDFTLSSTNHWGETGAGAWTLEVSDAVSGDQGVLLDWTLTLYGEALEGDDTYIYTDEFANFTSDAARRTLSDAGGFDAINAAAVTGGSLIDLNEGATSTLAGNSLSIAAGTVIEAAYAGDGDDTLRGNAIANTLYGGRGDDTLEGAAGNDSLNGGAGTDGYEYRSGDGSNSIIDESGNDVLSLLGLTPGQDAVDQITRVGNDLSISSGSGGITIVDHFSGGAIETITFAYSDGTSSDLVLATGPIGGEANGIIAGTAGDDAYLVGQGGDDVIFGGAGNDVLYGGLLSGGDASTLGDDTLNGGAGNDILFGAGGADLLDGGDGIDRLYGSDGADILNGGAGNDVLLGAIGDDVLNGDSGADLLLGGSGNDTIDAGADSDVAVAGEAGNDTLYGGLGDDILYGGLLSGSDLSSLGDDVLFGGEGNDILFGAGGADLLDGGDGADRVYGSDGNDSLSGGAGNDVLFGGIGIDGIIGGSGNDTIDAGAGNDVAVAGEAGNDILSGGLGDDILYGGLLSGGDASSLGDDTLFGGDGNDILFGAGGADLLDGGAGIDWLYGSEGDDTLNGGADNDVLLGAIGHDALNGDGGADLILGGTGNDTINAGAGNDAAVAGEAGDDILFGGLGDDILYGGLLSGSDISTLGDDTLFGDGGNDILFGAGGADALFGGDGIDRLYGSEGADTLVGGAGADSLLGGTGDDRFVFDDNSDNDTIQGFVAGAGTEDRIDFSAVTAFISFADVQASTTDSGGNAIVSFGDNSVTLIGVQSTALHQDDFFF